MKINNFSGGLSVRTDESLIQSNESIIYENIDAPTGVLRAVKGETDSAIAMLPYFYFYASEWISASTRRDYLEYREILYWTDDTTEAKKYDGTDLEKLGIDAPVGTPATSGGNPILDVNGKQVIGLVITPSAFSFSDLDLSTFASAGTGGNLPSATVFNYKVTLADGATDVAEVNFTQASGGTPGFFSYKVIFIFAFPIVGTRVRIYRDYLGTYYQISDVILEESLSLYDATYDISGNTAFSSISVVKSFYQYTMTYVNTSVPGDIESAPMVFSTETELAVGQKVTITNIPVSSDSQVDKKRLYRIGGNLTVMTQIAEIDNAVVSEVSFLSDLDATVPLDSYNNLPPDDDLQFIVQAYAIIFGALNDKLYFSAIGKPDYWPAANFIDFDAPITGILVINNGLLIFTEFKTFLLTGTTSDTFLKYLISTEQGCIKHASCKLVKNQPVWVSKDGVCTLLNGYVSVLSMPKLGPITFDVVSAEVFKEQYIILLSSGLLYNFNFQTGLIISTIDIDNVNPIQNIGRFENLLYCVINDFRATLFTGSDLDIHYKSPLLTEDIHSEVKLFNNIYIRSNGTFTLLIYIDSNLVATINLTGNKAHDVMPPAEYQRGTAIQFEITGNGIVYEIEYKTLKRQNGR